jgi:hypothetical protein
MGRKSVILVGCLGCSFASVQSAAAQVAITNCVSINDTGVAAYYSPPALGPSSGINFSTAIASGRVILTPTNYTLGMQSYWSIVPDGIAFGSNNALSFPSLFGAEIVPNQVFTIGVAMDMFPFVNVPPSAPFQTNDKFGWAHVEWEALQSPHFVVFDSAATPSGDYGIITGTTELVPEPELLVLIAIGGFVICFIWLCRTLAVLAG